MTPPKAVAVTPKAKAAGDPKAKAMPGIKEENEEPKEKVTQVNGTFLTNDSSGGDRRGGMDLG